ncbi:hypothetical protein ADZ36_05820 [Streptomyces fradiae]|uniref:Helix-turn-helix domain-containing protein n=2 Tax=Streptomyces TaxID=1883 RepID=A0A420UXR1_9ACTN|nr:MULTISPECIES: hypothetical protein [Streptomyces]KNE83337.1 hypothetical protein ADZ36_05820 [Streptomyces fradiae]PQM20573.1 hypothetical protein Sfr7A_25600 [Streptomyces xinghaiensis]RKM92515.1 hypothetical protein SFRA_024255 [Streptomyces xinghaiensis]RNC70482.1 hypothetical protein DC095_025245 [Streptomyces xinghaiensis]
MPPESSGFQQRLAAANARIEYGNDERTAGADDKARAIAEEAARRGRGGPRELARELGVSEKTISQAIARAKRAPAPGRTLPADTLDRLLAAERETLPPLAALQWAALAWLVRGTVIDVSWIEQPGQLLAHDVEDAELDEELRPDALAEACRGWSRVQALAVIDACQRDDLATLPIKE